MLRSRGSLQLIRTLSNGRISFKPLDLGRPNSERKPALNLEDLLKPEKKNSENRFSSLFKNQNNDRSRDTPRKNENNSIRQDKSRNFSDQDSISYKYGNQEETQTQERSPRETRSNDQGRFSRDTRYGMDNTNRDNRNMDNTNRDNRNMDNNRDNRNMDNNRFGNLENFNRQSRNGQNVNSRDNLNQDRNRSTFDGSQNRLNFDRNSNRNQRDGYDNRLNFRRSGDANNRNNRNFDKPRTKRAPRFIIETGSVKAQDATKYIIEKIHKLSPNFQVTAVDPHNNSLYEESLYDIVNYLDLNTTGISLILKRDDDSGETVPLVKQVEVRHMIDQYSSDLAAEKERELIASGSKIMEKVLLSRSKAEKKKSAIKSLSLQWSINVSDLKNQKRTEIESVLNKGENITVQVKSKYPVNFAPIDPNFLVIEGERYSWKLKDVEDLHLEMQKRELFRTNLEEILSELPCTFDIIGSTDTYLTINVLSTVSKIKEAKVADVKPAKTEKVKKPVKQPVKKKEEDLDSLYLFKIED